MLPFIENDVALYHFIMAALLAVCKRIVIFFHHYWDGVSRVKSYPVYVKIIYQLIY